MQFAFKFVKLKPVKIYQKEHNLIHNTSKQFQFLVIIKVNILNIKIYNN